MLLSALVNFLNIYTLDIRSRQCTLALSVMTNKLVSTKILFLTNKSFLWNENLYAFHRYLICILFKFDTGFFSCCISPVWLILHILYLSLHASWVLFLCLWSLLVNSTSNTHVNFQKMWNLFKVNNKDVRRMSMFLMSSCEWGRSHVFVNFEQIAHHVIEYILLTLNKNISTEYILICAFVWIYFVSIFASF